MNQHLTDFIKRRLTFGDSREVITRVLIEEGGWTQAEVDAAFVQLATPSAPNIAATLGSTQPATAPVQREVSMVKAPTPAIARATPHGVGPQPSATPGLYTAPKRSVKLTLALVVVFCALTVLAGGLFFYYYPRLFTPSANELLTQMAQAMAEVRSARFVTEFTLTGVLEEGAARATSSSLSSATSTYRIYFLSEGAYDVHESGNPLFSASSTGSASLNFPGLSASMGASLDFIVKDLEAYLRLRSTTGLPLIPIDFSGHEGQWYHLGSSDPAAKERIVAALVSTPRDEAQYRKELMQVLLSELRVTEEPRRETVDGVSTQHLGFTLGQEGVMRFVTRAAELRGTPLSAEQLTQLREALRESSAFTGELWIGTQDSLLYRSLLRGGFSNYIGDDRVTGSLTIRIDFRNHNAPAQIEAPAESKEFIELIGSALGVTGTSTNASTSASRIDR